MRQVAPILPLVRVLGIDYGRRRIGLALSDPSATLASPWKVLPHPGSDPAAIAAIAELLALLERDDEKVGHLVVGWPRRLDGSPGEQTAKVEAFARALQVQTGVACTLQDERLSSVEAESRLALRERDWRRRKARLDAAAAAVILQDYLDGVASPETHP